MIVTERLDNVEQLGYFIYSLCKGKDTYKLQRRDTVIGEYTHTHTHTNTHTPSS